MESFPEKNTFIEQYASMLTISNYTIESVIMYWWNAHGILYVNVLLHLQEKFYWIMI
jgi:hypothetical protein